MFRETGFAADNRNPFKARVAQLYLCLIQQLLREPVGSPEAESTIHLLSNSGAAGTTGILQLSLYARGWFKIP